jgi:integrase
MRAATYLMKSRNGVFYFRLALPKRLQCARRREVRISLRTRDKKVAAYLARKHWIAMHDKLATYADYFKWEEEDDARCESYQRGKALLAHFRNVNLLNPYARQAVQDSLSSPYEFKDLMFAWETDREYAETPILTEPRSVPLPSKPAEKQAGGTTLLEATERFLGQKKIAPASRKSYEQKLKLFREIVEDELGKDCLVTNLNAEAVRRYVDALPKSNGAGLKIKTIKVHSDLARAFLVWCHKQQYGPDLSTIVERPKGKSDSDKREPFSNGELQTLFNCEYYVNGTFKRSSDYWVPLLALFTGARQAELCQLKAADIYQDLETQLWVIDFNDNDDKQLKTEASRKIVPLHRRLKKSGFLNYVQERRSCGVLDLFDEVRDTQTREFSAFSKRFNRLRKDLGILRGERKRKDFHSFRHGVSRFLSGNGCQDYIINAITGHNQSGQSLAISLYSNGPYLNVLNEWVQKLDYAVDFDKICPNGFKIRLNP